MSFRLLPVGVTALLASAACRAEPVAVKVDASTSRSAKPASSAAPAPSASGPDDTTQLRAPHTEAFADHPFDKCEVSDEQSWEVRLYARPPSGRHVPALVTLAAQLPAPLRCGSKGEIYLTLSTKQARKLLGAHVSLSCAAGLGNTLDSVGWFAEVLPAHFVPASFAPHVSQLSFDTDEKLELITELGPCTAHRPRATSP